MRYFNNIPIRIKLSILTVVPALLALLIITASISVNEYLGRKYQSERSLLSLSKLVSWNSTAALLFLDNKAATQTLQVLKNRPSIIGAFLYNKNNQSFAHYQTDQYQHDLKLFKKLHKLHTANKQPPLDKSIYLKVETKIRGLLGYTVNTATGSRFQHVIYYAQPRQLHIVSPIYIDGELVGSLHLVDNLDELKIALNQFYIIMGGTLLLTLLMTIIVSASLQQFFAKPLLNLMSAMNKVGKEKNFSSRVEKDSDDEFGQLADVYNKMLFEIEQRDSQLAEYQQGLENKVIQRTEELSEKNIALENSKNEAMQAKEKAEEANKAKSQFLANMSHEIRTPMNSVMAMTEFLSEGSLTTQQTHFVENIQHSSKLLLSVINDILDFSKIESNQLNLSIQPFDCKKLIQECFLLLEGQAETKGIGYRIELPTTLPETLEGDDVRLKQILVNLLSNAIKFTSNGEVVLKTQAENIGEKLWRLQFEIQDTGIGIKQEKLEVIFNSFSQADESTTRSYGGTGLGLTIVKRLIELMQGTIHVNSVPGIGSIFQVQVELKQSDAVIDQPKPVKKCHFKASILVAEDYIANQLVIQHALEQVGCKIKIVENGAKAIEQFMQNQFDLIFMDCQMPKLDGYQATQQIRGIETSMGMKRIPILALTAHALSDEKEKCLDAGMDEWITKPFSQQDINLALQNFLPKNLIFEEKSPAKKTIATHKAKEIKDILYRVLDFQLIQNSFKLDTPKGIAFITKLKNIFEETVTEKLPLLEHAIQENNAQEIHNIAHGLKSISVNIGGIKLSEQCHLLEELSENNQLEQANELLINIKHSYEETLEELNNLVNSE